MIVISQKEFDEVRKNRAEQAFLQKTAYYKWKVKQAVNAGNYLAVLVFFIASL